MNLYEQLGLSGHVILNVSHDTALTYCGPHWHSEIEIVAPMQTDFEITVGGERFVLDETDIALVMPGEIHSTRSRGLEKALVLQFSPAAVKTVYEIAQNWGVFAGKPIITEAAEPGLPGLLRPVLSGIVDLRETRSAFKEADYYARLLRFFVILGQYRIDGADNPQDVASGDYTAKIADACAFVVENCVRAITLEEVADYAGFSKFHFSRLFKKYTDMSLSDFIADVRMRLVERLMADGDAKIADIAYAAGFGSLSAFNRAFKKNKGVSPTIFRKMHV